jgi:hypothetical protein
MGSIGGARLKSALGISAGGAPFEAREPAPEREDLRVAIRQGEHVARERARQKRGFHDHHFPRVLIRSRFESSMAVGFLTTSSPWKRRLWAKPSLPGLVKEVRRIYGEQLADPLLAARLEVELVDVEAGPAAREPGEQELLARWHPAEEGLRLRLLADGRIRAEANTSAVGPGYHACLIALLDRMASELGVHWTFDGEDEADETGYAPGRDLESLNESMLGWLQAICRSAIAMEDDGCSHIGLSMAPEQPRPKHAALAYSPMGVWRRERFMGATQSVQGLRSLAQDFFPWWSEQRDAAFWLGLGRVVAWCEFPWVTPRDEAERAQGTFALRCFERAWELDTTCPIECEIAELRELLEGSGEVVTPQPGGIGHRRRPCTFELLGRWSAVLPGHFVSHTLEEGKNLQLEDGQRAVYVAAFDVGAGSQGGSAPTAQELLTSQRSRSAPSLAQARLVSAQASAPDLTWNKGNLWGEARWQTEDTHRHLMAECAVDGHLLLLTITDEASASPEWAEEVARSARYRPQRD